VRNRLYDAGLLATRRVPARVISVGNLTVGGTGKTPTTLWLAERLHARGARVGIVARGYRKERPGVVVVGEAGRPLVAAREGGDEAVLLARRFAGPVVTGERRADAAALACARFGLDTIVLDDGFQHRALARDADLVLLAGDEATQWPLPAGPLREWASGLARADAFLAVDARTAETAGRPLFHAHLRPTALVRVERDAWVEEPLASLAGQVVGGGRGHGASGAPRRRPRAGRRGGARGAPFPRPSRVRRGRRRRDRPGGAGRHGGDDRKGSREARRSSGARRPCARSASASRSSAGRRSSTCWRAARPQVDLPADFRLREDPWRSARSFSTSSPVRSAKATCT
jgi:tetraacyldisaccharide 4'-kinase